MKKLKIYLDTSVISHLDASDAPENMAATQELWQDIQNGIYDVVVSDVDYEELNKCVEPKRSWLYEQLAQIEYEEFSETTESRNLALSLVEDGALREKSFVDARHIGCAIVSGCDIIVSWNFKHMVNIRTIRGVRVVTTKGGYPPIEIYSPQILSGGIDDERK